MGLLTTAVAFLATVVPAPATATATAPADGPFGYQARGRVVTQLRPREGSARPLPDTLVIKPGRYSWHGRVWNLRREGLARLVAPPQENEQRIVYEHSTDAFLSAVTWIYSHGNRDDSAGQAALTQAAKTRKLSATCGVVSTWLQKLSGTRGVRTRTVTTLTLGPYNSYDNGHTMVELWRPERHRWVLYDLDNNATFRHAGRSLDLDGFVRAARTGDFRFRWLAGDAKLDVSGFVSSEGYDYAFYAEGNVGTTKRLRRWYRRVVQVALISDDGGKTYFFWDPRQRERVERYSAKYHYLPRREWLRRFYG